MALLYLIFTFVLDKEIILLVQILSLNFVENSSIRFPNKFHVAQAFFENTGSSVHTIYHVSYDY